MVVEAKDASGTWRRAITWQWVWALPLSLLMLLSALPAAAHRGHAVWTDIVWTGDRFEIVHRMHLADAITVNRYMGGTARIEELRSLALVALYVDERFELLPVAEAGSPGDSVSSDPAARITLATIGAEIDDDFILVYQEWITALPGQFPVIDNFVLLDVEPEAQAFIRIKGPGLDEQRER